jgi:ferritin
MAKPTFVKKLQEQVGHEFAAHHQYIALAIWFDESDLPQCARHFYRQALEERNHAMMIVQYMIDRDIPVDIGPVPAVKTSFKNPVEPIRLALDQEQQVTQQIESLFALARSEGDALGEQFLLWFLKEQVEEVAAMTTLLTIAQRAGDNYFDIEDFVAREQIGDGGTDASAPPAAGGAL